MTTWIDVLKLVRWPTRAVVIDFECFFTTEYSLKEMSSIEYVKDYRFAFVSVALRSLAGPLPGGKFEKFFSGPEIDDGTFKQYITQEWFGGPSQTHVTWMIQNARFDAVVMKYKLGLEPPFILDLLDIDRMLNPRTKHSLEAQAEEEGLIPKGDTLQFKDLHWEDMDIGQHAALQIYNTRDVRAEAELLKRKIPFIHNPTVEIPLMRHTLKMSLCPILKYDFKLASRLVRDMKMEIAGHIQRVGMTEKELRSNKFVQKLQCLLPDDEQVPMKPGAKGSIPALAKDDDGLKWLLGHKVDAVRELVEARCAVKSWPLHLKRVLRLTKQAECMNGLIWIPLKYYGGHTGRWSGDMKVNAQNLGGKGRGKAIHPLIGAMRGLFMAPDGYKLVIRDLGQIEARMLAWMCGQIDLLHGFSEGQDIYSVFASTLFCHEVRKPRKDDDPAVAKRMDIERGFGKDAILGCGYGMGADKFFANCRANDSLRPLFDSGQYDWVFIKRLIDTYRSMYPKITEFWKDIQRAFIYVTKYPNKTTEVQMLGSNHTVLSLGRNGTTTTITLPSGRMLSYPHARVDSEGQISYRDGYLWGGSLTENVDQAMSRDILAPAILECERLNIPIALHCHDELVGCVPENQAEEALDKMNKIMCTNPAWADGIPLKAEGKIAKVYCK